MANILIVEDDVLINELVSKNLQLVGHTCISVYNGADAFEAMDEMQFDLAIFDVMLPGMSGFELMQHADTPPVIFLTAKSDLDDRVYGLALGADDYIVKPFAMPELLARVQAVLRRTHKEEQNFTVGNLTLDFQRQSVMLGGQYVDLTTREFALLDFLITNRNVTLTREKIIATVWGIDYDGDTNRVVDVYIQKLRQKLGLKDRIKSVYGMGYRFEI